MPEETPLLREPDRLIALNPEQRDFLERKQHEYRERSERAEAGAVQDVRDDAYYKLVVLGILLRRSPYHVTIGDAFDEIASADGEDKVNLEILENAFGVINAYNRGEMHRVVTTFRKEPKNPCS